MNQKKKIRVLQVISALSNGGVESMLMNVYRDIVRYNDDVVFDFVVHTDERKFIDEIIEHGGQVFEIENMINSGIVAYIKNLSKIIKNNGDYDAVHPHVLFQNGFILLAAWFSGVKIRISHSHLTDYQRGVTKLFSPILRILINLTATKKLACGYEAGRFLYKNSNFDVIPNAIQVDRFIGAHSTKKSTQEELNIDEKCMIIGHIGRFSVQKNHDFIIELANEIKKKRMDCHFICVGEGPLMPVIEKKIQDRELEKVISLVGPRSDIPELLKTFDVMILPSLYEGLPVVLVEAQAAGLLSVVSDTITTEADLGLELIDYVSLSDSLDKWIELICKSQKKKLLSEEKIRQNFTNRNYDIKNNSKKIMSYYVD